MSNRNGTADYMREAIKIAEENVEKGCGGPFGAVIVKDRKIIARGVNRVTAINDPTAHAEITAIREACQSLNTFNLTGCDIYTSCEPCPMCLGAIYWARLDKLYFASTKEDASAIQFDDQFIYDEIIKPIDKRKLFTRQMLREESLVIFQKWMECEHKKPY